MKTSITGALLVATMVASTATGAAAVGSWSPTPRTSSSAVVADPTDRDVGAGQDIRRVKVSLKRDYSLTVRFKVRDLTPRSGGEFGVVFRNPKGAPYFASVERERGRKTAKLSFMPTTVETVPVACPGLRHTWAAKANTVTIRVPSGCIGGIYYDRFEFKAYENSPPLGHAADAAAIERRVGY